MKESSSCSYQHLDIKILQNAGSERENHFSLYKNMIKSHSSRKNRLWQSLWVQVSFKQTKNKGPIQSQMQNTLLQNEQSRAETDLVVKVSEAETEASSTRHKSMEPSYRRWNERENRLYKDYLRCFYKDFKDEKNRRGFKVFKYLHEVIKTKSIKQCKSHHQKMLNQYKTIDGVILHFTKKYEKPQIASQ